MAKYELDGSLAPRLASWLRSRWSRNPGIERILIDESHLAGHRVSVRRVHGLVEERGLDPPAVVDRLGLDLADVYRALAYYHDHPGTLHEVEQRREARIEQSLEGGAVADPQGL
ncbi:MAG: DUF433 domain-containing protein [Haloarculaceae archaeon]